jgi:hypothetical protein
VKPHREPLTAILVLSLTGAGGGSGGAGHAVPLVGIAVHP